MGTSAASAMLASQVSSKARVGLRLCLSFCLCVLSHLSLLVQGPAVRPLCLLVSPSHARMQASAAPARARGAC